MGAGAETAVEAGTEAEAEAVADTEMVLAPVETETETGMYRDPLAEGESGRLVPALKGGLWSKGLHLLAWVLCEQGRQ